MYYVCVCMYVCVYQIENVTDRLSRNVGKELPLYAAH